MKFYMTVGVQYAREPHPQGLHPDGWVEVEAHDWMAARAIVIAAFGQVWSFLYEERDFTDRDTWHKRGRQATLDASGLTYDDEYRARWEVI